MFAVHPAMKVLAATLILLAFVLPARASTPVTVAQLEQTLAAARAQPDGKLAGDISALELTQRLSPSMLARLQSQLPGPQSQRQLSILAAESSFLELPPAELPSTPTPGVAQQRQIMAQVVNYVTQTIRKLPDFIATRDTRSFEDRPAGAYSYLLLHFTTQTSTNVVYRDGQERDTNSRGKKVDIATAGLISWGEFGPILTTVLLDAAKSQLSWSHWEPGPTGPAAVFRYAVPAKASHYQIQFCCVATPEDLGGGHLLQQQAPYHGEMAVDPSTGAILRITVLADLGSDDPLVTASIAVQYGPVDIGGKTYICPVRSEALALRHQWDPGNDAIPSAAGAIPSAAINRGPIWTRLNEVTFTHYHIYRGESRILTDAEVAHMTGQPADSVGTNPPPTPPAESEPAAQPAASPAEAAPPAAPAASAPATAQPAQPRSTAASPQPEPGSTPATGSTPQPEVTTSAPGEPTPASSANAANTADVPVFRTTARQVLVDVVVDKKNGDPVAGIPQSDFSVAEDSKPQTIDFFEEHAATASAPAATPPAMPPLPAGAVTNVPAAPPSSALYVFLLDSLNTEPQDQVFIHQQVLSFLHKMDPGTQVAVFTLGSTLHLLQGFTADPALLLAAVSGKAAERDAMAQNRSDNADDAQHIANLQSMRVSGAKIEAMNAAESAAQGYSFGARASMTFEALNALARYLEGIPGRKNLIWFASSFPVAFFPTPSEMEKMKNNPNLPGYVNHIKQTGNLFALSKIAVYPVSGAGVATSYVGIADSAGSGRAGGSNGTGSFTAESLNSASALTSMEQLANSTGGRAFTTNDIENALRKIVHDSDVYYTVGYAPTDSTEDGGFRRIDVKVTGGKYKLEYRQGYNASESGGAPAENPITPLLQLGTPDATGILYGAQARPAAAAASGEEPAGQNPQLKGPLTRYTVSFTIRAQDVSFGQASGGAHIAKLLIGVKAYAADGSALNWQATREAVELDAAHYESALKSGIPVTLDIDLPANTPAQLVTAVYDWNTTRSGTLEIPLHP
ncbi:MAG TPA: VWA domain-containing protein [Terracidiphilus sp.]|nr:VWA domain-containing protein [Terracidiphilus sp.]